MERIRSRSALALGGVWWVRGGGLIALTAFGLLAGVGCTGSRGTRFNNVLPAGWLTSKPATQITPAFNPQVQYLPDPTQDGTLRPGLAGQMFILAGDGSFTEANGDLYVMAEDITVRPPGMPQQVMEVWHFDAATLQKMRTKDERFGDCYALFLPYPSNWKDVGQIRISTQYKPKGDPTKEPPLSGPPQTLLLDFTPPGQQAALWLDKSGPKPSGPSEIKAMPNVARDIARGGLGAPLTGPQPNTATVPAGGALPAPPTPVVPAGGTAPPHAGVPFTPPVAGGSTPPPAATTPQLPPPMQFTPDRPQATVRGPNGETLNVTAMALPPGQSMPAGWTKQADGSIQPPGVGTTVISPQGPIQPQQWQQPQQQLPPTQPAAGYQPASEKFVPASERYQSRIQHGAFNPPSPSSPQPAAGVGGGSAAPLPALPVMPAVPPGHAAVIPTTASGVSGPGTLAVPPVNPGVGGGAIPPVFDRNSPVGAWATQPPPGGVPTVAPTAGYDQPLVTQTIKR